MAEEVKTEDQMTEDELKALQESEEFISNFKEEDFEDPDKAEEIRKRLKDAQTTIHQKRHYRDKVKELSTELEGLKKPGEKKPENPPKPSEEAGKEKKGETEGQVDPFVALEFRQDHPELSKDAVKEVLDYAGVKKITPEEALKKPVIQQFIKSLQTEEDVEDASIAPGNRGSSGAEKKDWSNASQKEIEAQRNRIQYGS